MRASTAPARKGSPCAGVNARLRYAPMLQPPLHVRNCPSANRPGCPHCSASNSVVASNPGLASTHAYKRQWEIELFCVRLTCHATSLSELTPADEGWERRSEIAHSSGGSAEARVGAVPGIFRVGPEADTGTGFAGYPGSGAGDNRATPPRKWARRTNGALDLSRRLDDRNIFVILSGAWITEEKLENVR